MGRFSFRQSTFSNINPADTREVCGEFADSIPEDSSAAVDAARSAFQSWRLIPAPKRAEILYRAAEIIVRQKNRSCP